MSGKVISAAFTFACVSVAFVKSLWEVFEKLSSSSKHVCGNIRLTYCGNLASVKLQLPVS